VWVGGVGGGGVLGFFLGGKKPQRFVVWGVVGGGGFGVWGFFLGFGGEGGGGGGGSVWVGILGGFFCGWVCWFPPREPRFWGGVFFVV